jgi:hypothetical protein
MSNKPAPLPLNTPLPLGMNILPLTSIEPVNSEPLVCDSNLNPNAGYTDAVNEPESFLGAAAACTLVN